MLQADVIFIFAMQHGSFPVQIAQCFFPKKMIVDFFISFYDTEVKDYHHYDAKSRKAKAARNADRHALLGSRLVLFLTKAERNYYTKLLSVDLTKINTCIVPVCVNEKPEASLDYFKDKRDTLNLCWCGSYVPLQGLDIIIRSTALLRDSASLQFHLYIWGASEERGKPWLSLISELHLENYITVHNQWDSKQAWEDFTAKTCDISLGIFGSSQKAKTVLAQKVVDAAAFRTPCITAHSAGLSEYFTGTDDVWTCDNNPEALVQTIRCIASLDYAEIKKHIDKAYNIYLRQFAPEAFEEKLHECIIRKHTGGI
jgi:glycosyltransferase involved in cell wall biosynthesis